MEGFVLGINNGYPLFILGIIFVWLAILTFVLIALIIHYRQLTRGTKNKNFDKILKELIQGKQRNGAQLKKLENLINILQKESRFHVQKVSLVRFNPFSQTGGNQSFSLALLNGKDDGLVVSSLHSREGTRIYAKLVKKGQKEKAPFSKEEREAILKAMRK